MKTPYRPDMCTCASGRTCASCKAWIRKQRGLTAKPVDLRLDRLVALKAQLKRAIQRLADLPIKQNKWRVKMLTTRIATVEGIVRLEQELAV